MENRAGDDAAILSDEEFREVMARRCQPLLRVACYLSRYSTFDDAITRPLVGQCLTLSAQFEEFLDACGAEENQRWRFFRACAAAIKRFSEVTYELLHVQHVLPFYRLLPIEQNFAKATEETLAFTCGVLYRVSAVLVECAEEQGLPLPEDIPDPDAFAEELPNGRLPRDIDTRDVLSVAKVVTEVATAFLNLEAETALVHAARRIDPEQYASVIPEVVSEKHLRHLQHQFHTLQSLYDTNVSGTETEQVDSDLPVLRGHISVVFHLLRIATAFSHYYERHVNPETALDEGETASLVETDRLLNGLMDYSISFSSRYIASARTLCQDMLKRYAEVGTVEVPIPSYRGFHVRPSTLIAKIVLHYGSKVRMELEDEPYDASKPIDMFRANEKINAKKRRRLATEIVKQPELEEEPSGGVQSIAKRIVLSLAGQGELVIYEQPLNFPEHPVRRRGSMSERVIDEIVRLQTTGTIDIKIEQNVSFVGDTRVLQDLELLAKCGYGEDSYGNNISLPKELSYLRR